MVECLTRDRKVVGSSLTGGNALCPSARHFILCLVLVQPRKTCPNMTEKLSLGRKVEFIYIIAGMLPAIIYINSTVISCDLQTPQWSSFSLFSVSV